MTEPTTAVSLLRVQARQARERSGLIHPTVNVSVTLLESVLVEAEARAAAEAQVAELLPEGAEDIAWRVEVSYGLVLFHTSGVQSFSRFGTGDTLADALTDLAATKDTE